MRIITAREQVEMLAPWRLASEFDPFKVTHRLRDEFHDWFGQQYQQDPSRYSDKQWGAGMSHWPVIEDFLKDKYPAAHRGLMTGREDASALLDYPEASGIMSRYDDETGSDIAPYSSADHHKLGYDPSEVAAGMVLLHNQNRDGLSNGYLDEDKDRLVDIFQKRQQMQRNYEQRTAVSQEERIQQTYDPAHVHLPPEVAAHYMTHKERSDPRQKEDIARNGIQRPVEMVTDGTHGYLSEGYHRTQAAGELGIPVPTHVYRVKDTGGWGKPLEPHLKNWLDSNPDSGFHMGGRS